MAEVCHACRVTAGRLAAYTAAGGTDERKRQLMVGQHARHCRRAGCGCVCRDLAGLDKGVGAQVRVACQNCGAQAHLPGTLVSLVVDLTLGEHLAAYACPLCGVYQETRVPEELAEVLWVAGATLQAP